MPDTGAWQSRITLTRSGVSLAAGAQVMRLVMDGDGPVTHSVANLGKITFTRECAVVCASTCGGEPDGCGGTCPLHDGQACADDGDVCTVDVCAAGVCEHLGPTPCTCVPVCNSVCGGEAKGPSGEGAELVALGLLVFLLRRAWRRGYALVVPMATVAFLVAGAPRVASAACPPCAESWQTPDANCYCALYECKAGNLRCDVDGEGLTNPLTHPSPVDDQPEIGFSPSPS